MDYLKARVYNAYDFRCFSVHSFIPAFTDKSSYKLDTEMAEFNVKC